MSSPTRDFQELNINEIEAARASRASGARTTGLGMSQPQRDDDLSSDEDEYEEDVFDEGSVASERTTPLQSPTNLSYDVRHFSQASYHEVKSGLLENDRFQVTTASEKAVNEDSEESDSYYGIQILETTRASVRFGSSRGQYACPRCTCRHPSDGTACRHIFWLFDRLRSTTRSFPPTEVLLLGENGFVNENENPYEAIREIGLNTVAERNGWYVPNQPQPVSEQRPNPSRKVEVREILAALSEQTREEYRRDIFDNFPDIIARDDVLVPRDLEATLARCLYVDTAFFDSFRNMVPAELYYEELFEKMKDRAQQSLTDLEDFIERGPEAKAQVDVQVCARQLRSIVDTINQNVLHPRVPLTEDAYVAAAEALVFILRSVAVRNRDAYADITWQRRPVAGETRPDRNLYQILICPPRPGHFVIDVLNNLGNHPAKFVDVLEQVHNTIRTSGAPERFNAKFAHIIRKLKTSGRG